MTCMSHSFWSSLHDDKQGLYVAFACFLLPMLSFLKHIAADSRTDGSSCFKQLGHTADRREFGTGFSCSLLPAVSFGTQYYMTMSIQVRFMKDLCYIILQSLPLVVNFKAMNGSDVLQERWRQKLRWRCSPPLLLIVCLASERECQIPKQLMKIILIATLKKMQKPNSILNMVVQFTFPFVCRVKSTFT